jgi:hypothetical protein
VRPAVAAQSRGAPSSRVTRPPVARATPAEGAAPLDVIRTITVRVRSRSGPNRLRTVVPIAHRGLFVAGTDHHVAFGRGVHFCLGAALARMEARTVISTMLHRILDWNIERIGGTAGAQDHSAATPPSHHVNQGSTAGCEHRPTPTGTGLRWMPKTSVEGRARSSRKADPNSQAFSSTRYASALTRASTRSCLEVWSWIRRMRSRLAETVLQWTCVGSTRTSFATEGPFLACSEAAEERSLCRRE